MFSSLSSRYIGLTEPVVAKPKSSLLLTAVPIQIPILGQTFHKIYYSKGSFEFFVLV